MKISGITALSFAATTSSAAAFQPARTPFVSSTQLNAGSFDAAAYKKEIADKIDAYEAAQIAAEARAANGVDAPIDGAGLVKALGFLGASVAAIGAIVAGPVMDGSISLPSAPSMPAAPAAKVATEKPVKAKKTPSAPRKEKKAAAAASKPEAEKKVVKKKASKGPAGYDLSFDE
eukprot:CAMPEP_0197433408 /NCGR_PEP_ID=MMETSP1175-20131217/1290_1 /TAXON_ID=1003142 /ORGANISM="Triceratium dubium, Strain CCMP147" /LENGTH=174 /DNA_ID=CAMNT_0042961771 /DNA_START=46 /DNA_END=570 /DNA_ORIENTATION=+